MEDLSHTQSLSRYCLLHIVTVRTAGTAEINRQTERDSSISHEHTCIPALNHVTSRDHTNNMQFIGLLVTFIQNKSNNKNSKKNGNLHIHVDNVMAYNHA